MLGETAAGLHPVAAVETMAELAIEAEKSLEEFGTLQHIHPNASDAVVEAVAQAAITMANHLEAAAIIFVVQALLTSFFGLWIAKGRGGFEEVMRAPLLYGSVGGLAVGVGGIEIPALILEPVRMLGAMAIPLMLLNLGLQLRELRVSDLGHSLMAVLLRMGGGVAFAFDRQRSVGDRVLDPQAHRGRTAAYLECAGSRHCK